MNRSSSRGDDDEAATTTSSAIAIAIASVSTEVHVRKHPPVAVFLEEIFETDIVVEGGGSSHHLDGHYNYYCNHNL